MQDYFVTGEDEQKPRSIPGDTLLHQQKAGNLLVTASCLWDQLKSSQHVHIQSIHIYFEKGVMTSFHSTFPIVAISSCEFHWERCLQMDCCRWADGNVQHRHQDAAAHEVHLGPVTSSSQPGSPSSSAKSRTSSMIWRRSTTRSWSLS
jgi:hypothetical protein